MTRTFYPMPPDDMPDDTVCFVLRVPNSQQWISAVWWVLDQYNYWFNWQRTDDKRGSDVALRWREMFWQAVSENEGYAACPVEISSNFGIDLGEDISMQIRISPDNECIIQMWCIDHWEDWFDASKCAPGAVSQPGAGGEVPLGECVEYNVLLRANERWLLPVPVSGDYTIEITDVAGGWNDGDVDWNCPDGSNYALGICSGSGALDAGDPLPTVNHMRLIAQVGIDYYDAYNTTIIVPSSATNEQVQFQANDASLGDNSGSISFRVRVCNTGHGSQVTLFSTTTNIICNRGLLSKTVVEVGDTFTFQIVSQAGCHPSSNPYDGIFRTSDPVTLRIIDVDNWTPGTGWQWFSPDNGAGGAPPVGAEQSNQGFAGNATTPGIVTFEVISIP